MRITVLKESPKGELSVTMLSVAYLVRVQEITIHDALRGTER
jgi:hypothetical protein